MKKNILLINPPENLSDLPETYPSGAFVLIGTMAHNLGHNVKIIHMAADKIILDDLKNIISDFKPDIVGVTINTFQTKNAKKITKIVKEADKNILVVVGGPHPSGLGKNIFNDFSYIDLAIFGEGEHSFLEIVQGKEISEIKGIAFKDKTDEIKTNQPRPPVMNLDYLPLPNLDLVGFKENKFRGVEPVIALPSMFVMGSRGCPFHCTYCNKSIWGFNTRFRRPELIIKEIEWLRQKYNVREIFFQDDNFNLNKTWLKKLLELIIKSNQNKGIVYKAELRANKALIDQDLLELLKKAGVQYIFYGVENGNQEMLNRMKKGLTIAEIKRAFWLTHKVGIKTIASFMIGLPGENKKTISDTFKLWKELKPHMSGYSLATPLPGTEFERILIEKGHLLDRDYDHYSLGNGVVRTDELTKEELEHYRMKIASRMELRQIMVDKKYFKELIIKAFKNPKKVIKRLKLIIWKSQEH